MLVWGRGRLGARLVLAFVGVALAAEAVFASITLLTTRSDLAGLATTQRSNTSTAVVSALENAYQAQGGWAGADIKPAVVLVHFWGAALEVESPTGAQVVTDGPAAMLRSGDAISEHLPLSVDGRSIGRLHLVFPKGGLTPGDRRLRSDLGGAVEISAVIAAAVALLVAVVVAKGLVRPIRRLSAAAQALGSGTKGIRVGEQTGPGELVELARAFDSMAASLEHHEHLRQAMVADVAHELRTPVAILQAETEALVDGVSAPTPDALVSLHDESLRLGRMVQDLQTLASADAAGLSLERTRVDFAAVAAGAADSLAGRFSASGVRLERDLSPAIVWADPSRLRQIVANLLANAAKFTPSGGTVSLTVGARDRWARLDVSDTGPGIPVDERERVFERFFRGSAGRKAGGSGIGLAVVKDLVEAHGGQVTLESQGYRGVGACFVVRIPLALDPVS
ncbi:MAG TPA: ATP-binding protein [Acidimicrobiales bacterium]|nr:ATP-binding protein [Acidimicrobiales bacterium]